MDEKETIKNEKQKIVIFNEQNEVQIADEGDTVMAFIINNQGLKSVASGQLTLELLNNVRTSLPKILDRLVLDYKHKNGLK